MAWGKTGRHEEYSVEFLANRPRVLMRDKYECQVRYEGCEGAATEVDHRVNLARNGSDAMSNLQAICSRCHKKKTAAESTEARRRIKEAGIHRDHKLKHPGLL